MRTDSSHVSLHTANPVASLLADESELVLQLTVNQPGLNAARQQIWGRKAEDTCKYCPQVANSGTSLGLTSTYSH